METLEDVEQEYAASVCKEALQLMSELDVPPHPYEFHGLVCLRAWSVRGFAQND